MNILQCNSQTMQNAPITTKEQHLRQRSQHHNSMYLTGVITQGPAAFPCSPPLFAILVNTPAVSG